MNLFFRYYYLDHDYLLFVLEISILGSIEVIEGLRGCRLPIFLITLEVVTFLVFLHLRLCIFAHKATRSIVNALKSSTIFWMTTATNFFFCKRWGWFSQNSLVTSSCHSDLTSALVGKTLIFQFLSFNARAHALFSFIWLVSSDLKDFSVTILNLMVYFALVSIDRVNSLMIEIGSTNSLT